MCSIGIGAQYLCSQLLCHDDTMSAGSHICIDFKHVFVYSGSSAITGIVGVTILLILILILIGRCILYHRHLKKKYSMYIHSLHIFFQTIVS